MVEKELGKLPNIRDRPLEELVNVLLGAATSADGKLTFNMNEESGTLADALRLLRDHLPKGLVPDPLPARTIQRLKTAFFRFRRSEYGPQLLQARSRSTKKLQRRRQTAVGPERQ
jgi:hypothetical protein